MLAQRRDRDKINAAERFAFRCEFFKWWGVASRAYIWGLMFIALVWLAVPQTEPNPNLSDIGCSLAGSEPA